MGNAIKYKTVVFNADDSICGSFDIKWLQEAAQYLCDIFCGVVLKPNTTKNRKSGVVALVQAIKVSILRLQGRKLHRKRAIILVKVKRVKYFPN